jgi:translation initiation factor eIF-2B subunit epsilon
MLEYSLEFLVSGGVGELFVFCSSHAAAIQAYLDSPETGSKWRRRKNLSIKCIVSDACASFGDAIRHLETLDIIKGDFVLISGDVISNVKLDAVVKEHKCVNQTATAARHERLRHVACGLHYTALPARLENGALS